MAYSAITKDVNIVAYGGGGGGSSHGWGGGVSHALPAITWGGITDPMKDWDYRRFDEILEQMNGLARNSMATAITGTTSVKLKKVVKESNMMTDQMERDFMFMHMLTTLVLMGRVTTEEAQYVFDKVREYKMPGTIQEFVDIIEIAIERAKRESARKASQKALEAPKKK